MNILLVESNEADARTLLQDLEASGLGKLEVKCVRLLSEALVVLERTGIDAVLASLDLPDSKGLETVRRLRQGAPDVPLVALTEREDPSRGLEALRLGAQDFLRKGGPDRFAIGRAVEYAIERHLIRHSLVESEQRYAALFQHARDAVLIVSNSGAYLDANPAASALTGYSRQELLSMRVGDLAPREQVQRARELWARLRESGSLDGETTILTKSGAMLDVEFRSVAEFLPGMGLSFLRDVTERKRTREVRERLAAVVDSTDDAVVTKTLDGIITSWNTGAERIFGYGAAEMVGKSIAILFPPELVPEEAAIISRLRRGERIHHYETRRVRKDGTEVDVSLTISPLRDGAGRIVGASKIARDVSERKRLEGLLAQARKMEAIGRLAGGVAHDFNNLLTVIGGYSSLMLGEMSPKDRWFEEVQEIARAGERAAGLTRQLLAFGRKQALQPRPLDLGELVQGTERMLRRLIGEDIHLASSRGKELGLIKADPGQVEQVIMNLVVNARDAMPQGGRILIETSNVHLDEAYAESHPEVSPGDYVMLAVTDTGMGMDKRTIGHLFEPFFTTKAQGKGTGLGLSTAYGIVRQSGGHIWVYSEPGKGSTFKVYFPRIDSAPEAAERAAESQKALRGSETILVIEDDPGVRLITCGVLRQFGYRVLEADGPSQGIEVCREKGKAIDLLVTDVVMPEMSGRKMAEAIREFLPGLKVLYISGYTENAIVHHGVLDEGIPFLQKPFSPLALAEKVKGLLHGGR